MNLKLTENNEHHNQLLSMIKVYEAGFISLIRERFGIIVHVHQVGELTKTILKACIEFNLNPQEYLDQLKTCHNGSDLLEHLIIGITVGETYFFRDKRQMHLLENILLPRLIQAKRDKQDFNIRIWSAGCSSGEEIFTIVMLLYKTIIDHSAWQFNLLGTDINKKALKKAAAGRYSTWSMRSIPDYYKQRYFTQENNEYILSSEIREKVKFQYLNLNENTYPSITNGTANQDIILCRNVLIYFDRQRISEIMQRLSTSLVEGGCLILGASDPIEIEEADLDFRDEEGIYFIRDTKSSAGKI